MKKILVGMALTVLVGCGAQQQRAYGIEEESRLVVRAEQLVGATITIEPAFKKSITKDDLTPYAFGVPGAKDKEEQHLETITVKVDPGTRRVKVERNGIALIEQDMYFAQGQTRELRIR